MDMGSKIDSPIIDDRLNILSYEQYLKDLETKKFTKMCMTEVINADMMIATFGEEKYIRTCREILESGNAAYKQLGLDKIIHVYAHTYKHFMAVANDEMSDQDFKNLMKGFHEQYELVSSAKTDLGGISRFVLVFGEDLIDRARSSYYFNQNIQNNFIEENNERDIILSERKEDVKIFQLLNEAIVNNRVVPFYQGIYDNNAGEINKYEALMRIYDENNNIWVPGMFLEAAKKLKLYISISKILIDKALTDFENKSSILGINISMYDIETKEMKEWILDRLRKYPNPSKVVIEFVETENYNNNKALKEFLEEIKAIGCKIAVDDFGVGYATYSSIVSLKPNTIKIDGDIIKNITTSKENQIILESICYMAKLIGADVAAEFVENAEIQCIVSDNGIKYSQGYHFAKPEPFEKLIIK